MATEEITEEVVRRYFTPAEANALLPELLGQVARITDRVHRARLLTERLREVPEGDPTRDHLSVEMESLRSEIEEVVDEIHREGVEVKGLAPALLDFPGLHNGQEAYLCWREGETRIEWWHPTHTGIAGRQKLDPAQLGAWEWCN